MLYSYKDLKPVTGVYEDCQDGYYHLLKDLVNFPDAWCYVIWSRRGPGKTYSGLWTHVSQDIPIIYMKRTVEDVNTISSNSNTHNIDLCPYAPINRDKLTDIQPMSISKGLGAFYKHIDGEPVGDPISYIMALNKIKSVKGFEASRCKWIMLDEFIPQIGERINHREGEQLLDLYMTVLRDKVARGDEELKLILFANAEDISTPITRELEIIDDMAKLNTSGDNNIMYLEDRGILLHHIVPDEVPAVKMQDNQLGIYKAMKNTAWGRKTFEGEFANNDFSNVCNISLKGMRGFIHLKYKAHNYYIYLKDETGVFYMCESMTHHYEFDYDLSLENDQKRFYEEVYFTLRDACINDRFKFKAYSMYDLIINYKKYFNV